MPARWEPNFSLTTQLQVKYQTLSCHMSDYVKYKRTSVYPALWWWTQVKDNRTTMILAIPVQHYKAMKIQMKSHGMRN